MIGYQEHKRYGNEWLHCKNKEEQIKIQQEYGARFSELFLLPYFDPVEMHVIDPMHNLMLGVSKHAFKTWVELGYLTEEKLVVVDKRMRELKTPSDIGRIADQCQKLTIH